MDCYVLLCDEKATKVFQLLLSDDSLVSVYFCAKDAETARGSELIWYGSADL